MTRPYKKSQMDMYEAAIKTFKNCDCVIVEYMDGPEIWRHGTELKKEK